MVDASPVKTDMMTHCAKAKAASKAEMQDYPSASMCGIRQSLTWQPAHARLMRISSSSGWKRSLPTRIRFVVMPFTEASKEERRVRQKPSVVQE